MLRVECTCVVTGENRVSPFGCPIHDPIMGSANKAADHLINIPAPYSELEQKDTGFKQGDRVAMEWQQVRPFQHFDEGSDVSREVRKRVKITCVGEVQGGAAGSILSCRETDDRYGLTEKRKEPDCPVIHLDDKRYFKSRTYVVHFPNGHHPWIGTEKGHSAMLVASSKLRWAGEGEVSRWEVIG